MVAREEALGVHPDGSSGSPEADTSPEQERDEEGALSIDSSCDLTASSSAIDPSPNLDASVDGSDAIDHVSEGTVSTGLDQKLNDVPLDAITQATDQAVDLSNQVCKENCGNPREETTPTPRSTRYSLRKIRCPPDRYASVTHRSGRAPQKGRVM